MICSAFIEELVVGVIPMAVVGIVARGGGQNDGAGTATAFSACSGSAGHCRNSDGNSGVRAVAAGAGVDRANIKDRVVLKIAGGQRFAVVAYTCFDEHIVGIKPLASAAFGRNGCQNG